MQVSEEDRLFWGTKRTEREMWLNIKEEIYKVTCKARNILLSYYFEGRDYKYHFVSGE